MSSFEENNVVEPDEDEFQDAVEKLDVNDKAEQEDPIWDGERIVKNVETALAAKEEGNVAFRNKDYDNAIEFFSKAIAFCPHDDAFKEQLSTFYGNRSAAYFPLEEYEMVVDDCTHAIELNPNYTKVIARRFQAYEKLDRIEEALQGTILHFPSCLLCLDYLL